MACVFASYGRMDTKTHYSFYRLYMIRIRDEFEWILATLHNFINLHCTLMPIVIVVDHFEIMISREIYHGLSITINNEQSSLPDKSCCNEFIAYELIAGLKYLIF